MTVMMLLTEHQIINVRVIVDKVSHSSLSKLLYSLALFKNVKKLEINRLRGVKF